MNISFISNQVWLIAALHEPSYLCHLYFVGCLIPNTISSLSHQYRCTLMTSFKFLLHRITLIMYNYYLNHMYTMRSFMFDILQGDMTRSKVILTFTCLKMYIARSGDTSGSRTTLFIIVLIHVHETETIPQVISHTCIIHVKHCLQSITSAIAYLQ